jgi:hypothetical protein
MTTNNQYAGQLQQWTPEIQKRQEDAKRRLGLLPEPVVVDAAQSGVFVELIGGKPVVSIRCSDSSKLDELTALARKILAAVS